MGRAQIRSRESVSWKQPYFDLHREDEKLSSSSWQWFFYEQNLTVGKSESVESDEKFLKEMRFFFNEMLLDLEVLITSWEFEV